MKMKRIRPKNYVHIKFQPMGKKPSWYWAIKIADGKYWRVTRDGDKEVRAYQKDGRDVVVNELLIGIPLEEREACLNLHYAALEEY